ncbi:NADP-dependent oxidoreductase [Kocuria tytonicola]|uniref:NADP-dependent oxidoreductase n=1 Tax=Kocuria tytonicola TaxID=2055946 RepID=A0A3L9L4D8_9MICC|nr:NADP-dependent oxidoreductase [Kocuria tytonicola]RLY93886.1 NADP-dependent oxidoreductase [Kocuria tytonicola]
MATNDSTSTQIQLVSRPEGWPEPENFRTVTVELPELRDGEVRVRNEFISVDPYMRGRMRDEKSYIPPFGLGETMTGGAVGRVVESRSEKLPEGTPVLHQMGWRDVAQGAADEFTAVQDLDGASLSLYLGVLGLTGMTAYTGLTRIAEVKEGDRVFVSGAAGAVGSTVGQLAKLLGASSVIGSAGSDEKGKLLTEKYGFDAVLNYKAAPIREQLAEAAGEEGVDVYFDNVGGDHLEAALDVLNRHGRVAVCGAISQYNSTEKPCGPDNMANLIKNSLTLEGFTMGDHMDVAGEFTQKVGGWFQEGKIVHDETVVEGIDHAVDAFLDMMQGKNTGKMVVKI